MLDLLLSKFGHLVKPVRGVSEMGVEVRFCNKVLWGLYF